MPEISQYEHDQIRKGYDQRGELIAKLKGKLKDSMVRLKEAEDDKAKALDKAAKVEQAIDSNPLKAENDKLRAQIREGKHRAAFAQAAKERGADEAVIDAVWKLSGYEAKGETPDPEAIGAMLDQAKENPAVGRLFGDPKKEEGPPPPRPGFGNGQGTKAGGPAPYTMADNDPRASDAIYQFNNFDRIAQAASERIARGEI